MTGQQTQGVITEALLHLSGNPQWDALWRRLLRPRTDQEVTTTCVRNAPVDPEDQGTDFSYDDRLTA